MSKKDKVQKIFQANANIEMKVADENSGFLAMTGWHQNFNDFSYGGVKGTVTYANGRLTIILDHKYSMTFSVEPIIKAAIKEMKLHKREQKKKGKKSNGEK